MDFEKLSPPAAVPATAVISIPMPWRHREYAFPPATDLEPVDDRLASVATPRRDLVVLALALVRAG